MWLSSDKWGTLNWGYLHQATDNLTLLIDLSGTVIESNAVFMEGNAFFLRPTGAAGGLGGLVPRSWASFTFCNMSSVGGGADCNAIPRRALNIRVQPSAASPCWAVIIQMR